MILGAARVWAVVTTPAALAVAAACASPMTVLAQVAATPSASAASAPAEAAYKDRVIETMGFDPKALDADEDDPFDPSGTPRQLRVESRASHERSSAGTYTLGSVVAFGLIERPNYGVISIEAEWRGDQGRAVIANTSSRVGTSQVGALTIRQRGLPLGEGRTLDNELGAIAAPVPWLARSLSRIHLPTPRLQGASSQWYDERQNLSALVALGQPLQYEGFDTSRLQRMPGTVLQVGAQVGAPWEAPLAVASAQGGAFMDQRRQPRPWSAAVLLAEARGLAPFGVHGSAWPEAQAPTSNARFDARALWLGAGGERPGLQWQAQVLGSQMRSDQFSISNSHNALGGWADVQWRQGVIAHAAGAYALQRGLSWLGLPMASDVTGAYWRGAWQSRGWHVDGGVDLLRSNTIGTQGYYLVSSVRRRLASDLNWGGYAALRNFNGRGHNLSSDLRWRHSLGTSDMRLDASSDGEGGSARRLALNHDWDLEPGFNLSTSMAGGRVRTPNQGSVPSWAAAMSMEIPLRLTAVFRGTYNIEQTGSERRTGANLGLSWPLSVNWALDLGANSNRGQTRALRSVDPLAPPAPVGATSVDSRSYFLSLRYEVRGGTGTAPLGGRAQDGGGALEGRVFFDANRNGRLDAGERGAADITVQLDGRYTTKTDAQGRYEFAWVAKGGHEIMVLNETLPLPWAAPDDGRSRVEVQIRETLKRDIAVTQQ
jgi:SdrD B-like domain